MRKANGAHVHIRTAFRGIIPASAEHFRLGLELQVYFQTDFRGANHTLIMDITASQLQTIF